MTALARLANLSVLTVSSTKSEAGVATQIMEVLAFPPKEPCNIRVSLESRYGICILYESGELACCDNHGTCHCLRQVSKSPR